MLSYFEVHATKILVQWSKRSHSKMIASMFAHSFKPLTENINTKQWELNDHSQLKKNRNPHVKSLYLHTTITWWVISQVTIGFSLLEKYTFHHALKSALLSAQLWKQCFISYWVNRPGMKHGFFLEPNRILSLWTKKVEWVVGRWRKNILYHD